MRKSATLILAVILTRLCALWGQTLGALPSTALVVLQRNATASARHHSAILGQLEGRAVIGPTSSSVWKYPCTTAGLQSAISDAINLTNGVMLRTIDASACTALSISSEIDLGNTAGTSVTLIMPTSGTWSVSITDGTSCGIKQFTRTHIHGSGTGGSNNMLIMPSSPSTSVRALYCTDPTGAGGPGSYVRAEGFQVSNTVGATMAVAAFDVELTVDASSWQDIVVNDSGHVGILVHGVSGGAKFDNVVSNGQYGTGALPVKFLCDSSGSNVGVLWQNGSIGHPGSGSIAVQITSLAGCSTAQAITFFNLYGETNNVDTTTPYLQATGNWARIGLYETNITDTAMGSTRNFIDTENNSGYMGDLEVIDFSSLTGSQASNANAIIDRGFSPARKVKTNSNGRLPFYSNDTHFFANISFNNLLFSNIAPTISSGFGSSPMIATHNGTGAFTVKVGLRPRSSGVIGLPTAANGWNCYATDITNPATNLTRQSASTASTATLTNYNSSGRPTAWMRGDTLAVSCFAR